jgi:hypothetical protein
MRDVVELKSLWLESAKHILLEMHHARFAVRTGEKAGKLGGSEALLLR